jgi:oligopeptide transport system permease protein
MLLRGLLGPGLAALPAIVAGIVGGAWLPRLVLVRLTWTVPLFALLLFVTIQLLFHVPGDPFASEKNAPEAVRLEQRQHYGVTEKGFLGGCEFFGRYLWNVVVHGYLGPSIKSQGRSVLDLLLPALPVSVCLGLLSLVIAVVLGLFLGVRAGLRPNSATDYASMGLALVGISIPSFVVGSLLLLVFAVGVPWQWLPVAGWGGYGHLVLPAIALALPYAAYIARLARAGTIEIMSEDFVRTARAKGLSEREVVLKHALKGAIHPVVSYLGPAAAGILTGSFVVEMLFNIPGMGRWFVNSALSRDYFVVLGTVFLECGLVIAFNLLVDMAYSWLDPRVRGTA